MPVSGHVLTETNLKTLGTRRQGKVRDIYEQADRLILVTTDRHSSFDRIIAHIPHKGQVLNQISAFWFERTTDCVPNHVQAIPDPSVTVAKKVKPLPIECVMRGYITGVTGTSLWTHYAQGIRDFGNFTLPEGLKKGEKLADPVFTPTTKSDDHDRPITPDEAIAAGLMTAELMAEAERIARTLFERGQQVAESRGLILVDTKYEFGIDEDGKLMLIDELHTPDSSRYWQLASYAERMAAGEPPENFDKEFIRTWVMTQCDPYTDPIPEIPKELVDEMSRRYIQMYEQLTSETFVPGAQPMHSRIEENLKRYAR